MKPILFSGEMVRAILDKRKTQTRRIVSPQPTYRKGRKLPWMWSPNSGASVQWRESITINCQHCDIWATNCPYGKVGDQLWIRETWKPDVDGDVSCITYRADGAKIPIENTPEAAERWLSVRRPREQYPTFEPPSWRPSIYMPRWASRLTLEVTEIRVERLNDISEEDAIAEGCQCAGVPASLTNRGAFAKLWESINGPGSWDENPWVWVVGFELKE